MQEEVAGGPSLRSPQECQEVWQYLSPYAEGMEGDSKMLSRLQGVCTSRALSMCQHAQPDTLSDPA